MKPDRRQVLVGLSVFALFPATAGAETAEVIDTRVNLALRDLLAENPNARALADRARAVLIMPSVVKGGFVIGGAYGEGALRLKATNYERTAGYYSVAAASLGLQVGVQRTSQAIFFLTDKALTDFRVADGWEVGADAELTLADHGASLQVNSTAFEKPVVAMVFGEDGLMVGASLEGAKYSPVRR